MDRRLSTIASQIENGLGLADVGTDHGFLPVHLARHGYTGNLYASDINEGPDKISAVRRAASLPAGRGGHDSHRRYGRRHDMPNT